MENTIKNRIQKIMELEQLNPASFAKAIQVNPSAISHILNDRNKPSTDIIIKILNTFRLLSSDWLILGIGSMYRNEKIAPIQAQSTSLFDSVNEELPIVKSEEPAPYGTSHTIQAVETIELEDKSSIELDSKPAKALKRIIVYYSDNSFEEFTSSI